MDIIISGISWSSTVVTGTSKAEFVTDYPGTITYVPAEDKLAELERIYDLCTAAGGKCCEGSTHPRHGRAEASASEAATNAAKTRKGKNQSRKSGV